MENSQNLMRDILGIPSEVTTGVMILLLLAAVFCLYKIWSYRNVPLKDGGNKS